jgi:glyoxylase-like metal-dependent hydrolase (beta-lactamase superfamily II)
MKLDRRRFLMTALAGPALAAPQRDAGVLLDRGFARVIQHAPGVYVTIADPTKGPECASNGGVLAGRDGVLIIEGHMQPAGAALEIEIARSVYKASVRGAVDTHFHLDHTFGNVAYAEQRIPIIAHEEVTAMMKEHYEALKSVDKASLLAPHEKKLAQAVDDIDRKRKQVDLATWKWMYDAIDAGKLALPTELLPTAELPKRIDLGGLVAVIEFHPGHTATDLIIRVPEHDLVFTGDLLFNQSYPVFLDADMISWHKVLDHFAGYDRRTRFVPGHGAICGRDTVQGQSALFDDLRAHAETMKRAGVSVEEAERRYVVPQPFQNYGLHSWDFTIGAAMRSYFTGLSTPHPTKE